MDKMQVMAVKTSPGGLIFELSNGQRVGYQEAVDMVNRGLLSAEHVNDGNPDKVKGGGEHRIKDRDHLPEPGLQ